MRAPEGQCKTRFAAEPRLIERFASWQAIYEIADSLITISLIAKGGDLHEDRLEFGGIVACRFSSALTRFPAFPFCSRIETLTTQMGMM